MVHFKSTPILFFIFNIMIPLTEKPRGDRKGGRGNQGQKWTDFQFHKVWTERLITMHFLLLGNVLWYSIMLFAFLK